MPRLLGVEIPGDKRIIASLPYIYGIGPSTAKKILEQADIDLNLRAKDLTPEQRQQRPSWSSSWPSWPWAFPQSQRRQEPRQQQPRVPRALRRRAPEWTFQRRTPRARQFPIWVSWSRAYECWVIWRPSRVAHRRSCAGPCGCGHWCSCAGRAPGDCGDGECRDSS